MGRTQCHFVAISLCAACGRIGFDEGQVDETPCAEPWGAPVEIVTGVINTSNSSISADERDLYFNGAGDLYVSRCD